MTLIATVMMVNTGTDKVVTANLKLHDSVPNTDVIDSNFTVPYRSSHDGLAKDVQVQLIDLMQSEIDRYVAGDTLKKDSEYTAMAANIQSGLVV